MCSRYTLTTPAVQLAATFGLGEAPPLKPRYNIAPSQEIVVVRSGANVLELVSLRWGLVPNWATDPNIGNRLINARIETITEKPAFRQSWHQRRCLVLADGFYEWRPAHNSRHKKQPYLVRRVDLQPFAIAGLWDHWQSQTGDKLQTCVLLTTTANPLMVPIHSRMPVILLESEYEHWLDLTANRLDSSLFGPYRYDDLEAFPVGPWVNHSSHDDPQCLQHLNTLTPSEISLEIMK